MKPLVFLSLMFSGWLISWGQSTEALTQSRFEQAKKHLYDFDPQAALPLLLQLYGEDPSNHNLEYLLGAAYTDLQPEAPISIHYLERARPFVSPDYDANNYKEKRVSIHLYYFLAVAYAQNKRCEEAAKANREFHDLIGKVGEAYLRDAQFWVDACYELQEKTVVATTAPAPATDVPDKTPAEKESKIVTQLVEYNTPTPLYGVQVGSFSKYAPHSNFDDIKNVEAFLDKKGQVRYAVGNFTFRNQAETLLKVLKESGYHDAFIVDVNKERKFTERIVTINDQSIKSQIRGKVHFRCQIGAFRDTIPEEMARKYLKISGIKENVEKNLTLLSVGHFTTYEEAKAYLDKLKEADIYDAFVVAYNYEQKVSVKDALTFLSKQQEEKENGKRKKH